MDTQRINVQEEKPDLTPFLDNGIHVKAAEWLHRNIFQPVDDLIDWLDSRFTKKLVEENTPKK